MHADRSYIDRFCDNKRVNFKHHDLDHVTYYSIMYTLLASADVHKSTYFYVLLTAGDAHAPQIVESS